MSITVSIADIEEEHGTDLPCPDCGLTLANSAIHPDRNFDCSCYGYGGPDKLPVPQFELELANLNFCGLWRMLGLDATPDGEIDPAELSFRLSNVTSWDLAASDLLPDSIVRYFAALRKIVDKASKYDRKVVWC